MNLDDYEPVAVRLDRWLNDEHKAGHTARVITTMLSAPGADICVFRAELWRIIHAAEGLAERSSLLASGHAEEIRGQGNVNRVSHIENCETSALGRALANYGYAGTDWTKRASREEMQKVARHSQDGTDGGGYLRDSGPVVITNKIPGKCSRCFGKVDKGEGIATKTDGKWVTSHRDGECPPDETEEPF